MLTLGPLGLGRLYLHLLILVLTLAQTVITITIACAIERIERIEVIERVAAAAAQRGVAPHALDELLVLEDPARSTLSLLHAAPDRWWAAPAGLAVNAVLKILRLDGNSSIGDEGASALGESLKTNTSLLELSLGRSFNGFRCK